MPLFEDVGNAVKDKVGDISIYLARKLAQNNGDITETASDIATDMLPNPIQDLITSSYNGMFNLMQQFMMSWMNYTPTINFQGETMTWLTALTAPLTGLFAVLGLILAGMRVMFFQRNQDIRTVLIGLARVVGVSAAGTTIATIFIPVSDLFAYWILEMAQPDFSMDGNYPTAETVVGILGGSSLAFSGLNSLLIFIQWCLMIIRAVALPIMVGFWAVAEAINMLKGDLKMTPVARWIIAFLLFKPVVAVIYGFAFKLMHGYDNFDGVFTGMAMIAISIFALPSLLRVLAPDAMAAGASGGGKELMALIGALTAAAAVVASGGAAAGASAGAGGATGGASGGAAGGAAGGGTGGAWQGPTLAESGWSGSSAGTSNTAPATVGGAGGPQSQAPTPQKNLAGTQKEKPVTQASDARQPSSEQVPGAQEQASSSGFSEAPSATLDQNGYVPEEANAADTSPVADASTSVTSEGQGIASSGAGAGTADTPNTVNTAESAPGSTDQQGASPGTGTDTADTLTEAEPQSHTHGPGPEGSYSAAGEYTNGISLADAPAHGDQDASSSLAPASEALVSSLEATTSQRPVDGSTPLGSAPENNHSVEGSPAVYPQPGSAETYNSASASGNTSQGRSPLPTEQNPSPSGTGYSVPHSLPNHRVAGPASSYPRASTTTPLQSAAPAPSGKLADLFRSAQYTIQSMPKLEDTFFDERGMR